MSPACHSVDMVANMLSTLWLGIEGIYIYISLHIEAYNRAYKYMYIN